MTLDEHAEIQRGFDVLQQSLFDVAMAFQALGGFMLTHMTAMGDGDYAAAADDLDELARTVGEQGAVVAGRPPVSNGHLLAFAAALRRQAPGKPFKFEVIDGGLED